MAPEGILLFQGSLEDGILRVERALPPLDRPGFAEGLFSDVRFLFLRPAGEPGGLGLDGTGARTCRWRDGDRTLDLIPGSGSGRILREYRDGTLVREAVAEDPAADGFHRSVELRVHRPVGYRMEMTRIR